MSTTSTGVAGRVAQVAHRAVEGQRRLLVARRRPRARRRAARARRRRRRRRSRRRGSPRWRTNRTRSAARRSARISAAYSSIAANARSSASSASRPVRSTSWPSRTIRISRTSTSGSAPMSSLIVLVPQSIAATRPRSHARPGLPPLAEQVEHLVAERVHAAALRERLAGEHVQALDPVGHAAGGDPLDLGDARPSSARRGEVALVRGAVRRGQLGVLARAGPASPSSARSPRGCRSATRRAGRSGRTSSGTACRWAAAARW